MDRVLQLELDRREQLALGGLETLRPFMVNAEEDVEVGFIPSATMCEWREWIEGTLDWHFNWDRLRFMARRVISKNSDLSEEQVKEMVEDFLDSVPRDIAGESNPQVEEMKVAGAGGTSVSPLVVAI